MGNEQKITQHTVEPQPTVTNTIQHSMSQQEENKYESESESEDDQFQESIVTGGDGGRRRVYECDPQPNDIYKYIGQIYATFDYMNQFKYRCNIKGTGTVIYIEKHEKRAYILTCAHNMRHNIMHCIKCNIYRNIKNNKGYKTLCIQCGQIKENQIKKVIKATKITFMPRSIGKNDFGVALIKKDYICREEFVPDRKYLNYYKPKDGFDWAFISFCDIYNIFNKQPNIKLINGNKLFSENFKLEYSIFGYPGDKNDEMWGMISDIQNYKQFEIKTNNNTNNNYLYQIAIDTMSGQSGSIIFYKQNNITNICAIHCGGSHGSKTNPNPYNIGTLIGKQIIQKWNQIKNKNNIYNNGFEVFIARIGINDIDIKVKWNGINEYKENDIKFSIEISEDNDFLFTDYECVFNSGNICKIKGLKDNTFYFLRAKKGNKNNNKNKYNINWWNNAAIIPFVTHTKSNIQKWNKYNNLLIIYGVFDNMIMIHFKLKAITQKDEKFEIRNINNNNNSVLKTFIIKNKKSEYDELCWLRGLNSNTLYKLVIFNCNGQKVSNEINVKTAPESFKFTNNYKPFPPLKNSFKQFYDKNKPNILIIWDYTINTYGWRIRYKIKLSNKTDYEIIDAYDMPYKLAINTITAPIKLNVCTIVEDLDSGKEYESEESETIIVNLPHLI